MLEPAAITVLNVNLLIITMLEPSVITGFSVIVFTVTKLELTAITASQVIALILIVENSVITSWEVITCILAVALLEPTAMTGSL